VYAIACVPAILLLESMERSQVFFHVTQLVAIVICVVASLRDIWAHRHGPADAFFYLAVAVLLLGLGWIGFTLIVIFTHMG
jgi:hypothetical protein